MESANFGWSEREGMHKFHANGFTNEDGTCNPGEQGTPLPEGMTDPVAIYPHQNGNCSITGGFWMDWGQKIFVMVTSMVIFALDRYGSCAKIRACGPRYIGSSGGMIVGFGETSDGELLVFHWTGEVVMIG